MIMPDFLNQINSKWTLFLDRDGVINKRPPNDYVKTWGEFESSSRSAGEEGDERGGE